MSRHNSELTNDGYFCHFTSEFFSFRLKKKLLRKKVEIHFAPFLNHISLTSQR